MTTKEKLERYDLCSDYIKQLKISDSLHDLLNLHRNMWSDGLQHPNIGPDEYGMFRTEDIRTMRESEVFLGNLAGLWTLPLNKWVGTPEEKVVTEQYRHHLISNVEMLRSQVYDHGLDREKIELAISKEAPEGVCITDLKVLDKEMDVLKLLQFSFKADGIERKSNLFLRVLSRKDDLLLVPVNWHKGEYVTGLNQIRNIPEWKGVGRKDCIVTLRKEFLRRDVSITALNGKETQTRGLKR